MELAIILVNWNRSADTINCINSINASNYKNFEIIIIDNNSTSCEIDLLKSTSLENCEIHYLNHNTGYTGGNNFGIQVALSRNVKYILLLNNDTFLADTALSLLVKKMNSDSDIAVLSPKIYFYPDTNILWSGAPRFNNLFLMGYLSGYRELDVGQCDFFEYVDYVSGCAMLIRSSIFKEVGLLSDKFFAVCEDLDFCFRVRHFGYKVGYYPDASIYHIESASSGGVHGAQYVYYQTRNYLLFHKLWSKNFLHLLITQIYYLIFILKRSVYFILTGRWRALVGEALGVVDYVFGRFGYRPYKILSNRKINFK
jgi:GT2 family glycosyltransferase